MTSSLKNRLKNTEEGVKDMSSVIERFYGDELKEARIETANKLASLLNKLFNENRADEAQRVLKDESFRNKLLDEMFPQEGNS